MVMWNVVLYHDFFFRAFLTTVFLMAQLVSCVFPGGLPMKKNTLKASSSCLKKETLKTVLLAGR